MSVTSMSTGLACQRPAFAVSDVRRSQRTTRNRGAALPLVPLRRGSVVGQFGHYCGQPGERRGCLVWEGVTGWGGRPGEAGAGAGRAGAWRGAAVGVAVVGGVAPARGGDDRAGR